jgi:hypothetical protein
MNAFRTNVNIPKVRMFTGKVSNNTSGLIVRFITPMTKAAINAVMKPLIWTPGIKKPTNIIKIDNMIQFKMSPNIIKIS